MLVKCEILDKEAKGIFIEKCHYGSFLTVVRNPKMEIEWCNKRINAFLFDNQTCVSVFMTAKHN